MYLFTLPFFVFFGNVARDLFSTVSGVEVKIRVMRIVVLSIITSTLVYGFSDKIMDLLPEKLFPFVCVIFGISSYQIWEMIEKLDIAKWVRNLLPFKDKEDKKKEVEQIIEEYKRQERGDK